MFKSDESADAARMLLRGLLLHVLDEAEEETLGAFTLNVTPHQFNLSEPLTEAVLDLQKATFALARQKIDRALEDHWPQGGTVQ